jgi:TIR domain/Tetratricopeptide repeat
VNPRPDRLRHLLESFLDVPWLMRGLVAALFAVVPIVFALSSGALELTIAILAAALLGGVALISFDRLLKDSGSRGYEIVEQDHEWDLVRPDGSLVLHRKRLRVRYLNQAISVVDFAWGDGNLFAEYSCEPGRVVDQFVTDDRKLWVLISLGDVRRRGDEEVLTFRRAITDGFTNPKEWIEADSLEGKHVSLKVVFPKGRPPEHVEVTRDRPSPLGPRGRTQREHFSPAALSDVSQRKVLEVQETSSRRDRKLRIGWAWAPVGVFISHSAADAELAQALAAHLRAHGLTAQTSTEGDPQGFRRGVADASAIIIVAGHEPASDFLRSEWSAALDEAWSPEPQPVSVLLAPGAHPPASLGALPVFALEHDLESWPATFERLRRVIWQPEGLLREADIRPDRTPKRVPPNELILSTGDAEHPSRSLREELAQRRERLEAELHQAQLAEDADATRRSAYALGITLRHLGEPERAREMLGLAIDLTEKEFGSSHPMVADGNYNLALASMGRARDAVKLLERAIELGESSLGPDNPKVRAYKSALERIRHNANLLGGD